jgi:hypothetical protein
MSKPSAIENWYFDLLGAYLRDNWVPCPIYPNVRAVERSHPRGVGFWETGGALKGHYFFAVGMSKLAHLEYDADHDGFESVHQVTHAKLAREQWQALSVVPGEWMAEGMQPRRSEWFKRVLERVLVEGMSGYELAHMSE